MAEKGEKEKMKKNETEKRPREKYQVFVSAHCRVLSGFEGLWVPLGPWQRCFVQSGVASSSLEPSVN